MFRQLNKPYTSSGSLDTTNPYYYGAKSSFVDNKNKAFDKSPFQDQVKAIGGNQPAPPPIGEKPMYDPFHKQMIGVAGGRMRPEFPPQPKGKPFGNSPFAPQIYGYEGEDYYAVNENRLSFQQIADALSKGTYQTENIGNRTLQEHMSFLPLIYQKIVSQNPLSGSEIMYLTKYNVPATLEGIQRKVKELGPNFASMAQNLFGNITPPVAIGIQTDSGITNRLTSAETFNPKSRGMYGDLHGSFGVEGIGEDTYRVLPGFLEREPRQPRKPMIEEISTTYFRKPMIEEISTTYFGEEEKKAKEELIETDKEIPKIIDQNWARSLRLLGRGVVYNYITTELNKRILISSGRRDMAESSFNQQFWTNNKSFRFNEDLDGYTVI